jgi:polyisoprenoid-binding protein YceI
MSPRTILPAVVLSLVPWLAAGRCAVAAETYTADPVHSSVIYRIKHMNASYAWGRFNDISGTFALDEANPEQSRFEFQVKTESLDSGNAKRDQHLKSPDFFNAVQFPTIKFKSTSVTKSAEAYEVTGDLTLHGVTRPVTVRVVLTGTNKNPMGKPIAGIEATFSFKRTDFGMTKMVEAVGDYVWMYVSIEGVQQ